MGMNSYSLIGQLLIDLAKQGGNAGHTRNKHGRQSAVGLNIVKLWNRNSQGDSKRQGGTRATEQAKQNKTRNQRKRKNKKRSGVPPTHPTKICSSSFLDDLVC